MLKADNNIVLIGMPGCGKTTIGKVLAKKLHRKFIDIDSCVEKTAGMSITQIFQEGEDAFRSLERAAVLQASNEADSVISTGGGVVKNYLNIVDLKKNGVIFFIDRPIENIIESLDSSSRPLLKDGVERIYNLFEERYDLYKKYSDFQILNDDKIEDVIEKIVEVLK